VTVKVVYVVEGLYMVGSLQQLMVCCAVVAGMPALLVLQQALLTAAAERSLLATVLVGVGFLGIGCRYCQWPAGHSITCPREWELTVC
jgi:hypothetical protein